MKLLISFIVVCFVALNCEGLTVQELHDAYFTVFPKTHNRNAASHLWSTYVIKKVTGTHTVDQIYKLFAAFCPISGSIVTPNKYSKWNDLELRDLSGNVHKGSVHVCCSPCTCDLQQFVHTDELKIRTKNGIHSFKALVIGDPCIKPQKIPREASELTCKNGVLQGATKSTHGYVVIGIVQSNDTPAQNFAESTKQQCEDRKKTGYRYGMGKIFLNVASINPIGQ